VNFAASFGAAASDFDTGQGKFRTSWKSGVFRQL
jgi:hypothetical protein